MKNEPQLSTCLHTSVQQKLPWGHPRTTKSPFRALGAVTHLGLGHKCSTPFPKQTETKANFPPPRKTGTIRNNFRTQSIGYQSPPHFVSPKNYQKLSTHTPIHHMFPPHIPQKTETNGNKNGRAITAPQPFGQSIKVVRQPYAPPTKHYVAIACLPCQRKKDENTYGSTPAATAP
jgi:hypothetical protein